MKNERPSISTVRDRPRRSASEAARDQGGIRRRGTCRTGQRAIVGDDELGDRWGSGSRFVGPELTRRRIGRERRDHRRAAATRAQGGLRRADDRGWDDGLHQDVDRAATGEADIPGLLVADAVADHPGVAGLPGVLDLLGRGAFHAAPADRAHEPPVVRDKQDGSLRARRRSEGPDDDGPPGVRTLGAPGVERVQEVSHGTIVRPAPIRGGGCVGASQRPSPRPCVVCMLMRMAVRTNLLLPEALLKEVDRFAGPRGRSRFVAEALEAKLKRERLREAIRSTAGILKAEDYPYWRTSEDVIEWVRAGRAEKTRVSEDITNGLADGGSNARDA